MLDLGMEKAGFDIVMVSEKYLPFLNAYKYSRKKMKMEEPEHGYFNDDIADYLQSDSVLEKFVKKDSKDNIIGFIGGPPCPDFSTAGKNKGVNGDNGKLTKTYFDLISKMKPDFLCLKMLKACGRPRNTENFMIRCIEK